MAHRSQIPIAITAFLTFVLITQYFFGFGGIGTNVVTTLKNVNVLLALVSIALGLISLILVHTRIISRKTPGRWPYSIILLVSMAAFLIMGFTYTPSSETYNWWYLSLVAAISSTTHSMAVLLMATATYRAFRIRNWESVVLLIAFLVYAVGSGPIFEAVFPAFSDLRTWFMNVLNMAGQRAILITGAVGALSLAVRTIIMREKGVMGEE